jgi:phosphate transport system substrate-binding protein
MFERRYQTSWIATQRYLQISVWIWIAGIWIAGIWISSDVNAQGTDPVVGPSTNVAATKPQEQTRLQPAQTVPQKDPLSEQEVTEKVLSLLMALEPYRNKEPLTGKLEVFGTPTMGSLAHRWAEGFKRFHPQAVIEISEMKGAATLKRLAQTPGGVAMISRPLYPAEMESLKNAGMKQPVQIEVGQQAMAVFVNSSNPLVGIDHQQFLKIFSVDESGEPNVQTNSLGDLTWGELGVGGDWKSRPVHVIHRDAESGTQSFLKNQLLENRKMRPAKQTLESTKGVLETIARDPQAIGLSNLRSAMGEVKSLKLLQGTEEISCSDSAILDGAYPLVRRISLVVDAKSEKGLALATEFVKFSVCQDGQREAILAGFFPLDPPLLRGEKAQLESEEVPKPTR